MTEKNHGREIAFAETYDEVVKCAIEKTFLNHGISYLIKVDKVRDRSKGLFDSKKKYSFYINRFQQEDAKEAIQERQFEENEVVYLI